MSRPRRMDEAAPVEGVSQLVERFNQCGLAVLVIAQGRGRKPTYDLQARERVVQEVQPSRIGCSIKRPSGPG